MLYPQNDAVRSETGNEDSGIADVETFYSHY